MIFFWYLYFDTERATIKIRIHYLCTYTCFNICCYYEFIHSFRYQTSLHLSQLKLILISLERLRLTIGPLVAREVLNAILRSCEILSCLKILCFLARLKISSSSHTRIPNFLTLFMVVLIASTWSLWMLTASYSCLACVYVMTMIVCVPTKQFLIKSLIDK